MRREGVSPDPPSLYELHRMVKTRAGHLAWPLKRLSAILEDFPEVNWRMVAGRCLDYIDERPGVGDGPRTLRTFMEREQRELDARTQLQPRTQPARRRTFVCPICGLPVDTEKEVQLRLKRGAKPIFRAHLDCQEAEQNGNSSEEDDQREEAGPAGEA